MRVEQTNRFKKAYKKLHINQLVDVDEAIGIVITNPDVGERKKGNLSRLWVYKFRMLDMLALLGYTVDNNGEIVLTFVDVGPHENFYRDLKK